MAASTLRIAGVVALALMLPCGSAIAAPPVDPPGKSGDAPGQQKDEGSPAEPTPPGQIESEAAEPQAAPVVDTAPPAEPQGAAESPRFTNAAGKPKHNVPAAAEAAPETSVSAPGNSGRHKITICHNGHAITVDVHAARAHIDGHGDTYALAGAKGRAACPHSSSGPTPQNETPSGPGGARPDFPAVVAAAGRGTNDPGSSVDDPADPAGGVSATSHEQSGGVLSASGVAGVAGGSLPFTGAPLDLLVLFGVGLVGGGLLLRLASLGWAPGRSSSR